MMFGRVDSLTPMLYCTVDIEEMVGKRVGFEVATASSSTLIGELVGVWVGFLDGFAVASSVA